MEDGNIYNPIELDNKSSGVGEKKYSLYDKYCNANGGSDVYNNKIDKKNNTSLYENDIPQYKLHDNFLTKNKNKHNIAEQQNANVKPIPRPIITKHSVLKTVIKRTNDDFQIVPKVFKENGDSLHSNVQSTSRGKPIDEDALQKAIEKLHGVANHRSKPKVQSGSCKKKKVEPNSCNAQYLGLQPAVKFKCSKCSSTFPNLAMLKQHHRSCVPPHHLPAQTTASNPQTSSDTNLRFTRSVYLCSACGTYYESWNLFLHIREVHNRHTCLFCFGMFSQAHKLASHLVLKHNIQEDYFTSKEDLSSKFSESFYLLCCKCEKVFTEREDFISHECVQVIKQCSVCKLKGSHSPECPKNSKVKKSLVSDGEVKKCVNRITSVPSSSDISSGECVSVKDTKLQVGKKQISTLEGGRDVNKTSVDNNNINSDLSDSLTSSQEEADVSSKCIEEDSHCDLTNNNIHRDKHNVSVDSDTPTSASEHNNTLTNTTCHSEQESQQDNMEGATTDSHPTNISVTDSNDVSVACNSSPAELQSAPPTETLYQIHPSVSWPRKYTPQLPTKPPPRNRRPPKRYQTADSPEESYTQATPPPYIYTSPLPIYTPPPQEVVVPAAAVSEIKETVNRVPKLTVKIPKTVLEKESTSDYSSESEDSDKLTVDMDTPAEGTTLEEPAPCDNDVDMEDIQVEPEHVQQSPCRDIENHVTNSKPTDTDIMVAGEDISLTELTLDHPLDKYTLQELLKVFLQATRFNCIYCNHARKVAVNAKQLSLHFVAQHRFSATVDSITAEELLPETIVHKIKSSMDEVQNVYLNLEGYETNDKSCMKFYDGTLECFQCFYFTTLQKDLYSHNRKMHQKTILLCIMCKSNFYSYSELLCHLCPGTYEQSCEMQFHCCLCPKDSIPSAFRLMVHLRKSHNACDVCLEHCHNQSRLSNHVWKHKLHHLCYRCGIAYRNKPDITKHLFWKHGTESVLCKKCLQKRWPHVYHFCVPPNTFLCEECNSTFTRAVSLKVHKRLHSSDFPYSCSHGECEEKFVSKKLLTKHQVKHLEPAERLEDPSKQQPVEDDKNDIIVIDDKPDDVMDVEPEKVDNQTTPTKPKKAKKNKKSKEKVNLLIDVNLPELNLSESDSSDESDTESSKKAEGENPAGTGEGAAQSESMATDEVRTESMEEIKQPTTVPDVWDNFKMYQAQLEKEAISLQPPKPRHVCDSDHDYCVIPMSDYEQLEEQHRLHMDGLSPSKENRKKSKSKRKNSRRDDGSSSSDSSSDSDSSCSCGSNCSCSSSSGSSSSSSSSDSDSESSLSPKRGSPTKPHKDSDASAVLDVVMPLPEPVELPIAESDLDTEETDTDEEFYDEYPQRLANKILAEKRNKLLLLAAVAPCVNNGTYVDTNKEPDTPEVVETIPETKKKVKSKKRKKPKKASPLVPPIKIPLVRPEESPSCPPPPPNKITISLQTNTVIDKRNLDSPKPYVASLRGPDSKRASKRRRVPNKFYGYSSDEEFMQKQQLPPKLEWRKEDLPSSSGVQHQPPAIPPPIIISGIMDQEPRLVMPPKTFTKEPIYTSSEEEDSDSSREGALQINHPIAESIEPPSNRVYPPPGPHPFAMGGAFPRPAGFRQAREGESVYCYCRCPYDEVSEMIACDAQGCAIEWFHFECVGITVPPKGKWYCPDCRQKDEYYNLM